MVYIVQAYNVKIQILKHYARVKKVTIYKYRFIVIQYKSD